MITKDKAKDVRKEANEMKRTNVLNEVRASRIGYFASPSFWVCEATDENYRTLRANNIQFTQNTFVAANGERCTRFEFKEVR